MALNKSTVNINFAEGLDTKSDPWQVSPGRFLALQNSIFSKGGLLQKRNGFGQLTSLPDSSSTFLTTYNGNLLAIGNNLEAYSQGSETWFNKGTLAPVELSTLSLLSSNTNQSQVDTAIAPNGLVCTVYTDNLPSGGTTVKSYKYVIADSTTGQNVVAPTVIPVTSGAVSTAPRVFALGKYFMIVFSNTITATPHLQYISINSVNLVASVNIDISPLYTAYSTMSFDGVVANNNLYLAWTGSGSTIRMSYIDSTLVQHAVVSTNTAHSNSIVSICADTTGTTAVIWVAMHDAISSTGYILAKNQQLSAILAPTQIITATAVECMTTSAQNGSCTVLYEVISNPAYDSSVPGDYVKRVAVTQGGSVGSTSTVLRGVGLASKSFIIDSSIYMLLTYASTYQPTYFLSNSSGNIIAKLAYSNGSSTYYGTGLPSVSVSGTTAQIAYFFKDQIQAVNKNQGVANASGVFSQTGINLVKFKIGVGTLVSAEIGKNLHLTGGFMWMYDGYTPVEHNFHLWPDYIEAEGSSSSGGMLAQQYFYVGTYEWSDNQGNIFRSAPSIPQSVNLAGTSPTGVTFHSVFSAGATSLFVDSVSGLFVGQVITDTTTGGNITAGTYITAINGSTITISQPTAGNSAIIPGDSLKTVQTCSATVYFPTLRLTYKTANPVKLVLYRWSTAQQVYYQTTSLTVPTLNDTTVDYVTITDTNPDSEILGNNILYTTGGVVEDIAAPATNLMTLFQTRLFLVDAEDRNLIWFSKQVIESTPVEMSDLFTIYVPPTTGVQGSTGPITALASMDDKLVIFKKDAVYYINGSGPDNTGANNQFSEPIYITSTVGCANQQSIVLMPNGLMFQSDKGIWLLSRDGSSSYIGAPVEGFTQNATVLSAVSIPGTNQVRFTLDSGVTLMYDYYYSQWGTFVNVPALSSTLYGSLHTYVDKYGKVYQESPGKYLDGSNPVLMSFTTSWLNLSGLQGYQRAYYFWLIGSYLSPHQLRVSIAYDYNPSPTQASVINPNPVNFGGTWGGEQLWGSGGPWGGAQEPGLEQWRVFLKQQKCESFQITISEYFDASYGTVAGAGLTLSGLDLVVGTKLGYPKRSTARSVG